MLSFIFLQTIDLVSGLWGISPLLGLLAIAITYLIRQLTKKEKELETLNEYIRSSEKDNIKTLEKVTSTLDKVMEKQNSSDSIVMKEIENLKQLLLLKLKKD